MRKLISYLSFSDRKMFPYWSFGLSSNRTHPTRWSENKKGIALETPSPGFADHIEMSGLRISVILSYGVNRKGVLRLHRHCVWPALRTKPNVTQASLSYGFGKNQEPSILIDGKKCSFRIEGFSFDGILTAEGSLSRDIGFRRRFTPHPEKAAFLESIEIINRGHSSRRVEIKTPKTLLSTKASRGVYGSYGIHADSMGEGSFTLAEGESHECMLLFYACRKGEVFDREGLADGFDKRDDFVDSLGSSLILDSPDSRLNRLFSFAKIRLSESIYETAGGLMHSPGGGSYYAALWTNDQCEYANPLFPFLGYDKGIEQSENGFRLYGDYMDPGYAAPLVSSIIAEGRDYWNGAGDRGDAAMYAYGAARFYLALGDRQKALECWPRIQWALEYCRRKKNSEGIVESDCDELENRFPAGSANLSTNCLYYDALLSSTSLAAELDETVLEEHYRRESHELSEAIESYFGAEVEGYRTYRYHKDNKRLRSWISFPVVSGLNERREDTLKALFSPRLWTEEGLLSVSPPGRLREWQSFDFDELFNRVFFRSSTFWDRATLYGLRGAFLAGASDKALEKLIQYGERRLLGDHVPYPIEAFPEGNRKHLSAESSLFCRVITEGLFGIRPVGFRSFEIQPSLPRKWPSVSLNRIKAFGTSFDLTIRQNSEGGVDVICRENGQEDQIFTLSREDKVRIDLKTGG